MTDEARKALADDIKQLRKFTYDSTGGNQARQAIDRLEAALRSQPGTLAREEVAHHSLREKFENGKPVWQIVRIVRIVPEQQTVVASFGNNRLVAEAAFHDFTPSHEAGTQERIQSSTEQSETPIGHPRVEPASNASPINRGRGHCTHHVSLNEHCEECLEWYRAKGL